MNMKHHTTIKADDPDSERAQSKSQNAIEINDPLPNTYTCKHCDRPFKSMDGFRRHLTNKHGVKFYD